MSDHPVCLPATVWASHTHTHTFALVHGILVSAVVFCWEQPPMSSLLLSQSGCRASRSHVHEGMHQVAPKLSWTLLVSSSMSGGRQIEQGLEEPIPRPQSGSPKWQIVELSVLPPLQHRPQLFGEPPLPLPTPLLLCLGGGTERGQRDLRISRGHSPAGDLFRCWASIA